VLNVNLRVHRRAQLVSDKEEGQLRLPLVERRYSMKALYVVLGDSVGDPDYIKSVELDKLPKKGDCITVEHTSDFQIQDIQMLKGIPYIFMVEINLYPVVYHDLGFNAVVVADDGAISKFKPNPNPYQCPGKGLIR